MLISIHYSEIKCYLINDQISNLNLKDPNCQKKMTRWDEEFKYGFTEALDSDYDSIRKILRVVEKEHGNRGQIRE